MASDVFAAISECLLRRYVPKPPKTGSRSPQYEKIISSRIERPPFVPPRIQRKHFR